MVAISSPARTLAEQIYGALKGDLLAGAFTPGAALLTRDLLARYGCGISPLREALARLVGEGLLVASGHRGVRMPLPSRADLDELYRIRSLLECEALKLAMEHGDDQWEAVVLGACHRLERASLPGRAAPGDRGDRVIEWEARHRAFHAALIAAAPAPKLLRLVDQMVDQTERYRALRLVHSPTERLMRDIAAEHRALVDAALARDARATELLAEHLERTRRFVAGLFERDEAARKKKPAPKRVERDKG